MGDAIGRAKIRKSPVFTGEIERAPGAVEEALTALGKR
jgi:hypothetical protein